MARESEKRLTKWQMFLLLKFASAVACHFVQRDHIMQVAPASFELVQWEDFVGYSEFSIPLSLVHSLKINVLILL